MSGTWHTTELAWAVEVGDHLLAVDAHTLPLLFRTQSLAERWRREYLEHGGGYARTVAVRCDLIIGRTMREVRDG